MVVVFNSSSTSHYIMRAPANIKITWINSAITLQFIIFSAKVIKKKISYKYFLLFSYKIARNYLNLSVYHSILHASSLHPPGPLLANPRFIISSFFMRFYLHSDFSNLKKRGKKSKKHSSAFKYAILTVFHNQLNIKFLQYHKPCNSLLSRQKRVHTALVSRIFCTIKPTKQHYNRYAFAMRLTINCKTKDTKSS